MPSESDSDGEDELEATSSSMKQPPLLKQLKGILSEYPDGGQIIKELIQNAEDAGANEVRILYDGRRINREVDNNNMYRKFFQGPALCVYNDATFTETDWEGIQMIYTSVKEDDPLKVGRFGLGFKSVFHITDHPCVLSGNHLLLIDPQNHQSSDKVKATMRLDKLERYKGMDIDAFLEALGDTFGINREVIKSGQYPGTVFWFPLRDTPSSLSETLYDEKKMMDLFDVFKCEADSILIFLQSLTSISLNIRGSKGAYDEVAKVEIIANIKEIKQKREEFKLKIKNIPADYNGDSVHSMYTMTVRKANCGIQNVNSETTNDNNYTEATWMIVNYFMGGNASPEFRALITDPNLGYCPYVGLAMPLSETRTFVGHVFCFLPLPKEGLKLTGLPVHVNGFFALSQNRHHLKWATEEQKGKKMDDKSILWNEVLISEALPLAYELLVQSMVQHSEDLGNTDEAVNAVYDAIPDIDKVTPAWQRIVPAIFDNLKCQQFLFYRKQSSPGKSAWIGQQEACYARFKLPTEDLILNVRDAVVKVLHLLGQKYVAVPNHLFDALSHQYGVIDTSPRSLCDLLHMNTSYKNMADADKIAVLEYLLFDKDYSKMKGLELLPLETTGAWITFESSDRTIYKCSDEETLLFPGLQSTLLRKPSNMSESLSHHFKEMCDQGTYQIRTLIVDMAPNLIKQTMNQHFGRGAKETITASSTLTVDWLSKVWTFITSHGIVSKCRDIPLVPLLKQGTWGHPQEIELLYLTESMILKHNEDNQLPEEVGASMESLSVKLLPSLPDWIPRSDVKFDVLVPSPASVLKLLATLFQSSNKVAVIAGFNQSCGTASRDALTQYLNGTVDIETHANEMLKHLEIFVEKSSPNSDPKYISLTENRNFIGIKDFPVKYPRSLIDASQGSESLLRTLGATEVSLNHLILETMNALQQERYSPTEVILFMENFVRNFHLFDTDLEIMTVAKEIQFLQTNSGMKKASDLFNPDDPVLQDLFLGEPRFPERVQTSSPRDMYTLQCLGLKDIASVNADDILEVAVMLDSWSRSGQREDEVQRKASAFLDYLNRYPSVLDQLHNICHTLASQIQNLDCIIHSKDRSPSFPGCLPWHVHPQALCKPSEVRDTSMCHLVGSTMPIIAASAAAVSKAFGWNQDPPVKNVLDQLAIVKEHFLVGTQTDSLIIVKAIYQFMDANRCGIVQTNLMEVKNEVCLKKLIWNGEGFSEPTAIVVHKTSEDIDLRPHFYTIPEEFHVFQQLFHILDCHSVQTVDVLMNTLSGIERKFQGHQVQLDVSKDLALIVKILNRLAERKDELEGKVCNILIPIKTEDSETIMMKHVDECVYDKDPQDYKQDEEEEKVFIVHEGVPIHTAKELGVKSLNRKALSDTEELSFEAWGQDEPLTTRIHTLLKEGYMDGLSVPKELIQNADDAGATTVKILYDERKNENAKERLLSKGMKECQGPALWVFNDATFSKEDLVNITKLNGATKAKDIRKIGKFGLGFCSVYNLTDVPSFVSGTNIVIFDPHQIYLNSPGLKIDLSRSKNRSLLQRHRDQFKPFQGIFGCDPYEKDLSPFEGTLFRFPLRTFEQSQNSKISAKFYSKHEVQALLSMFINAAGNMFLFTQNLQKIEIYHLPPDAASVTEQSLLFSMMKGCLQLQNNHLQPMTESIMSRVSINNQSFTEIQKRNITLNVSEKAVEVIPMLENVQTKTESSWVISWATGTKEALELARNGDKYALPLAAIGIPCSELCSFNPMKLEQVNSGFYKSGHIFCFLPLPLVTDLQVHVNGFFDVTSDRRQLLSLTEDDKNLRSNQWNEALMGDALVNAFLHLLKTFSEQASASYIYHSLWPTTCARFMSSFQKRFFRRIIVEECQVFKSAEKWMAFHDIVFLDPNLRQHENIGDIAFELLTHFPARNGKMVNVVEMPMDVLSILKDSNQDKIELIKQAMVDAEEMLSIFLKNILDSFWETKRDLRDKILMYALLESDSKKIQGLLKKTKCIPTEPNGTLSTPKKMVHPVCSVSSMFLTSEGRFPAQTFQKPEILKKLVKLGMIQDNMPGKILIERCYSIEKIAEHNCCTCAFDRIMTVLEYLRRKKVQESLEEDKHTKDAFQTIAMLPVLAHPESWKFSWKADTCTHPKRYTSSCDKHHHSSLILGQPIQLYRQKTCDYVGSVESVVDESCYSGDIAGRLHSSSPVNVFMLLGVPGFDGSNIQVPVEKVVEQIVCVANEYNNHDLQFEEVKRIYQITFTYLNKYVETQTSDINDLACIKTLCDKKVIMLGKQLVMSSTVAFHVKRVCSPDLHCLPDIDSLKSVYKTIGVKDRFSAMDVINVLKCKKNKWKLNPCDEIDVINDLLQNLEDSMEKGNEDYSEYKNVHAAIVAPDEHCILRPTYELVIDDANFETSSTMNILHGRILPEVAKKLGVKSKKKQSFDELSYVIPFGQKESLVTRIQGLLDAYPCDESIMKELLQNADDANATEIHFIKDYRKHSTEKMFGNEKLQGPALCVFNNSYFTKADIVGIHNLGQGSKGDDLTKTGQYGVGFNAVYHLTDTPSFMTKGPEEASGGTLCIFDPMCINIPKATKSEPGLRCQVDGLRRNFPDVLLGYLENEDMFKSGIGTMFRFPLRCEKSEISNEVITEQKMNDILSGFTKDMFEALLFVKNLNSIKISNMTTEGLIEEYSVHTILSKVDEEKRKLFFKKVNDIVKKNKDEIIANLKEQGLEVGYEMIIEDSKERRTKWYIVQRFGFDNDEDCSNVITNAFRYKQLGHLPVGGIAVPLKDFSMSPRTNRGKDPRTNDESNSESMQTAGHPNTTNLSATQDQTLFIGRAFCFLPLPIVTALPVHVHGHFVLDHEARRNLWLEGCDYKRNWNESILANIVAKCWISAIKHIQTSLVSVHVTNVSKEVDMNNMMRIYHEYFPLLSQKMDYYWTYLVEKFYNTAMNKQHALFPVVMCSESEGHDLVRHDKKKLQYKVHGHDSVEPEKQLQFGVHGHDLVEPDKQFQTEAHGHGSVEPDNWLQNELHGHGSVEPDNRLQNEVHGHGSVEPDNQLQNELHGHGSVEPDNRLQNEIHRHGSVEPDNQLLYEVQSHDSVEPDNQLQCDEVHGYDSLEPNNQLQLLYEVQSHDSVELDNQLLYEVHGNGSLEPNNQLQLLYEVQSQDPVKPDNQLLYEVHGNGSLEPNNQLQLLYEVQSQDSVKPDNQLQYDEVHGHGSVESGKKALQYGVQWVALAQGSFQGVFNDITRHVPVGGSSFNGGFYVRFSCKDAGILENVLKQIGMKLIQTPLTILNTMKTLKMKEIVTASPKHVRLFLNSFERNDRDSCTLGKLDALLEETSFKSVINLSCITRYMMLSGEDFLSDMDGLPVLLTQGGVLNKFRADIPIFVSKFCRLLPGSASLFLSYDLLDIFDQSKMYETNVIVKLNVSKLVELLPKSLDPTIFAKNEWIPWIKDANNPIKPEWIQELFQFVYNESLEKPQSSLTECSSSAPTLNHKKFQENLHKFDQWSILPSQEVQGEQKKFKLIPISAAFSLLLINLDNEELDNEELDNIFKMFNIPSLDRDVFKTSTTSSSLMYGIQKLLAAIERPYDLLKCLFHHKSRISTADLKCEDGETVLSYFDRSITSLKKYEGNKLAYKLRCLPLYTSQLGKLINIEKRDINVFVLPDGMPHDGIERWAHETKVVLLRQTEKLAKLYDYLGLSLSSTSQVYLEKILPNIVHLPQADWLKHIAYIKDKLLVTSAGSGYDPEQTQIINRLKDIAFVNVKGERKRVKELYCWSHPVFKCMLEENMFPPEEFQTDAWRHFLELLGLNVDLSDQKMIEFALKIESEGRNGITELVKRKSEVLVKYAISPKRKDGKFWEDNTLFTLKTIKFMVPHVVNEEASSIFKQPNNGTRLMCFDGSLKAKHERLCWTTMNILSISVKDVEKSARTKLGIQKIPPISMVVRHCQNVCDAMKVREKTQFVTEQMESFYDFFANTNHMDPTIKEQLKHTPFVYLPDDQEMVATSKVVIELTKQQEIKPYLFKAPNRFGKYERLFISMGSEKLPNLTHYLKILETLKGKVRDGEMNVDELRVAKSCLENLFCPSDTNIYRRAPVGATSKLYLPNRQKVLCDSKQVTVVNREHFEKRLRGNVNINYFIGFQALGIDIRDPDSAFRKLPNHIRPVTLSSVVQEKVCESAMVEHLDSRKAKKVEEYIHSVHFLQGVLRLVKHQLSLDNMILDDNEHVLPITKNLKNAKVVQVSGLKTVLVYKRCVVPGSEKEKKSFL